MFERDLESLSTADLLESAAEHRAEANRTETRLLVHAQIYADRFHPSAQPSAHPSAQPGRAGRRAYDGGERAVVLGGDGCPEILEFAIAEFAVMLGISPRVAADYLGQALALRHRFPFTWARVLAGEATPWKACRIVADCAKLSEDAAAYVDQRIARLIYSITPYRLDKIVKAAKLHADPDLARAEAAEKASERGVFVNRSTEHGTKTMYIKASCGAVIRHDAAIANIAEALKTFGDTRPVQHRRAEAVGIIADPRFTEELLTQARHHRLHTPATTDAQAPTDDAGTHVPPPPPPSARGANHPAVGAAGITAPSAELTTARSAEPTTAGAVGYVPIPAPSSAPVINHPAARAPGHAAPTRTAAATANATGNGGGSGGAGRGCDDEKLLSDWTDGRAEPGPDDEADRDAPHPSTCNLPEPLDTPDTVSIEPFDPLDPGLRIDPDDGEPLDAAAQRAVHARLARIKQAAHTRTACPAHTGRARIGPADTGPAVTGPADASRADTGPANAGRVDVGCVDGGRGGGRLRPGQTQIYVHLTDRTLATGTGTGVLRAEHIGPLLADQLAELIGYGPYTVKPVIDLNDAVSVDAYEIPDRIRERVKLTHPVELFPFGTQETHRGMDLDHIQPYDPLGPPGQTSTQNLAPLGRFGHRVKTHARGWKVRRLDAKTLEWVTPRGFTFHVDPTGTYRVPAPRQAADPA